MSKEARLAKSSQKETTSNNFLSTTRNSIICNKNCTENTKTELKSIRERDPIEIVDTHFLLKQNDVRGQNRAQKIVEPNPKKKQFQELYFRTKFCRSFCGTTFLDEF